MREPPAQVSDDDVLGLVSSAWAADVDAIQHLPLGFGAHHWAVSSGGTPILFVTLDGLGPRHSAESLESAYAAAAALAAAGLDFVVPSLRSQHGRYTEPLVGGRLSCTRWLDGTVPGSGPVTDDQLAQANAADLARLHAATPPTQIPIWRPVVDEGFSETLESSVRTPWNSGPFGERARCAVGERVEAIRRWTASYHSLVRRAQLRTWVPTHGEPHTLNQLVTTSGVVFVDWESLALAPAERDLRTLVSSGYAELAAPDWAMIEMFDLEWRLDELAQYSAWFASPHSGTESDRVAFGGLLEELNRPDWGPG